MSTRTKKRPAKKVAKTSSLKKRTKAKSVSTAHVENIFKTVAEPTILEQVEPNSVLLFVNGNNRGTVDTSGMSVQDFTVQQATRAGIRSFSVYADGRQLTTADARKSMSTFAKIEIVAKDSRA